MLKNWYNVELSQKEANVLKTFLKAANITFEPSACYNLVHFEILADENEVMKVNNFLDTL